MKILAKEVPIKTLVVITSRQLCKGKCSSSVGRATDVITLRRKTNKVPITILICRSLVRLQPTLLKTNRVPIQSLQNYYTLRLFLGKRCSYKSENTPHLLN